MTSGQKWAASTVLLGLLAIASEILYIHHERSAALAPAAPTTEAMVDPDDLVFLKRERPSNLADLKQLDGTTIWVSAGGQMDYYPYAGHHADFAKPAGTLLGAEPMVVKDAFEQVKPKTLVDRIAAGDKQVFLAFTLPRSSDPAEEYAVPVGFKQGADYTFYTDDIFFYDDPHQLYSHWGPQVWHAVDTHQVILGMNERQVQLSLGQVSKNATEDVGNREVTYFNLDKPFSVTFVNDRVTAFQPVSSF